MTTKVKPLGKMKGWHVVRRKDSEYGDYMEYEVINYEAGWQLWIEGEDKTEAQVRALCDAMNKAGIA